MYVLFLVAVSVFNSLLPPQQTSVLSAYLIILAIVCVIAVLAETFFGSRILIQSRKKHNKLSATAKKVRAN